MAVRFERIFFPEMVCVNELIPIVSKPTISGFSSAETNTLTSYDDLTNIGKLFTDGTDLYSVKQTNSGQYTLKKFDTQTQTFGTGDDFVTPTYQSVMIPDPGNKKIYFYSGRLTTNDTMVNSLYVYDIVAKTVTLVTSGGTARAFGCGCLNGTKLMIFGGLNSGGSYIASFQEYNISGNSFTALTSTPAARQGGAIVSLSGNTYLTGATYIDLATEGKKLWKWNGSTWETIIADVSASFELDADLVLLNNQIYLVNVSPMATAAVPNISRLDESGTPVLTPVVGTVTGTAATQVPANLNLGKLASIAQVSGTTYFLGDNQIANNGNVSGDLFGTINLSTNTITATKYKVLTYTLSINASELIVDIVDPASLVGFEFKQSESGTIYATEGNVSVGRTINGSIWEYAIAQPLAVTDNSIYYTRIRYKTERSSWSVWSDWYNRGGV